MVTREDRIRRTVDTRMSVPVAYLRSRGLSLGRWQTLVQHVHICKARAHMRRGRKRNRTATNDSVSAVPLSDYYQSEGRVKLH